MTKIQSENEIEDFILNLVAQHITNKKLLFIIKKKFSECKVNFSYSLKIFNVYTYILCTQKIIAVS